MSQVLAPSRDLALAPHRPADILDLRLTRYDYDYNRDPDGHGAGGPRAPFEVSGFVRNRPIFPAEAPRVGGGRTTYRVDYTAPGVRGKGAVGALVRRACAGAAGPSSHTRDWYRAGLTAHADDGPHPRTVYQNDYGGGPTGAGAGSSAARALSRASGRPARHPWKTAAGYDTGLLTHPHDGDQQGLPEKITAWSPLMAGGPASPAAVLRAVSRLPPASARSPPAREAEPLSCTSWLYGDVSQAKPGQLPQGLRGSAGEDEAESEGADGDLARRVWRLAGRPRRAPNSRPWKEKGDDRTNPVPVPLADLTRCQGSRRLENEGYVAASVARAGHPDPWRLPELPGPYDGRALAALTNTNAAGSPGERAEGQLTGFTRELAELRNSHGTLHAAAAIAKVLPAADLAALGRVRILEKRLAVDRFDPHRHKLH